MNSYAGLTTLKNRISIEGTGDDSQLRLLLEASSRAVDKYCHRFFYVLSAIRYFSGAGSELYFKREDLLSVTTLKTDEDGDGTFENTLTENTDFFLFPLNSYPKIRAEINPNGNFSGFGLGSKRGIKIEGEFGYGDGESASPYSNSGTTTNEVLDISETDVDVVSGSALEAGQTILVESEQMYIKSISSNTLTVIRGVNGTSSATHAISKIIYIYAYPSPIRESVIMLTSRLWKRKDSAFATIIASPELGQIEVFRGMDTDVKSFLTPFVKSGWFA